MDICAIGKGGKSNLDILLNYKTNPESVKGILYKKDNTIHANDFLENIQNLDKIPMPGYKGWNLNAYLEYKSRHYIRAHPIHIQENLIFLHQEVVLINMIFVLIY